MILEQIKYYNNSRQIFVFVYFVLYVPTIKWYYYHCVSYCIITMFAIIFIPHVFIKIWLWLQLILIKNTKLMMNI